MIDNDNGPTDQEIEEMEIDRQIEHQEECLRGEHGEEAQRAEEKRSDEAKRALREKLETEEEEQQLLKELGSPALVKACMDPFDYALKLRSGEVIRFHLATWHGGGWLTLVGVGVKGIEEPPPGSKALPYPADRGVDVRLDEILWVMDAPEGS